MNIVSRAINLITQPKSEWARIDAEPATVGGLFTGYAMILALLPLIGSLLAGLLFAGGFGFTYFLVTAALGYAIGLGVLFLMIFIADAVAPGFNGVKTQNGAAKVLIYSATPIWLAGILNFIPGLNLIVMLVGFGFAAYLMYLGSQIVLKIPQEKAVAFTAVVIVIWIIISMVVSMVLITAIAAAFIGGAVMTGGAYLR